MEKNKLPIKDAFKILSFLFAAVLVTACSKKVVFPDSKALPGADVVLTMEKSKNNNFELELEFENLAKPERLTPPKKNYVVWLVTERHGTLNIGNLRVSNRNKASLVTVTPYKPIRVFVTGEDKQDVIFPSSHVVLNSEEFEID